MKIKADKSTRPLLFYYYNTIEKAFQKIVNNRVTEEKISKFLQFC